MPDLLKPSDSRGRDRALAAVPTHSDVETRQPRQQPAKALLCLDRVSKWYGPIIGVNEVSLSAYPGIMGLVGTNGAGKSTLMRLATGQLKPDIGTVQVMGFDAWTSAARRHIGYCPDVNRLYEGMTGRQFLHAMGGLCGYRGDESKRRAKLVLSRVGMSDRADRKIGGNSKGERQRIKLAQALLHDPSVLILDEPLNGIDPQGRQELVRLFRELASEGKALLISSHELEELERLTSQIAIMVQGRMAAIGSLTEIRELLNQHPHTIFIRCENPRRLARACLELPEVIGAELVGESGIRVRTRESRRFFADLAGLVLEEGFEVLELETRDESAQSVLGYLLGGSSTMTD